MKIDSIDRKIIRELQLNSRISNNDLAQKINLSPSPCLRRLKNLERNGVIECYTALINQKQYGLPITAFISIKLENHRDETVKAFEEHIQTIDEVMECYLMSGRRDYSLSIVTESLEGYERLIKTKLNKIPGIASFESNFAIATVKRKLHFPAA